MSSTDFDSKIQFFILQTLRTVKTENALLGALPASDKIKWASCALLFNEV